MSKSAPRSIPYYPIFLDLDGRRCVVVGGGTVARRKVEKLVEAGADVVVIAPEIGMMPAGVTVLPRPFQPDDLAGAWLVIGATDDSAVNAAVAQAAEARHIWVNIVDAPQLGSAILPAVLKRGLLQFAVSTGGASPALARRLRDALARQYGAPYGEVVALLGRLRAAWEPQAAAIGLPGIARRRAWEAVLDLPLLAWAEAERIDEAEHAGAAVLASALAGMWEEQV